jgi:CTP synthase (UTP-ammonia lyase)
MTDRLNVAVIGDFDDSYAPHVATNAAISHSAKVLGLEVSVTWLATEALEADLSPVTTADVLWCAPGSPYRSLAGALAALRFGRENAVPTLGTCGGCQHIILEYARNVLGFQDAQHAEYDPYGSRLFISSLTCSLAGRSMPINLEPGSLVAQCYGTHRATEQYYCNFGLNPLYRRTLEAGGLHTSVIDDDDEPRVFELPEHPFYIATLFVPQNRSTIEDPHPLVTRLLSEAANRNLVEHGDDQMPRFNRRHDLSNSGCPSTKRRRSR